MGNCLTWMKSPCCMDDSTLQHPPTKNSTPHTAATPSDPFDVRSEDLEKLLDYIDQAIEARKHSTMPNEASNTITSSTDYAATILNTVTTRCKDAARSDVAKEAYHILCGTLETAGNLHWVAAGLSIVALILNRMDRTGDNLEQSLHHLEALRNVGRHVKELYPQLPPDDDTLRQATSLIAEGAIICCTHLKQGSLKRFAFAGVNNSNFAALQKRITDLYPDIGLAVQNELLRRTTMRLSPMIAEYPANAVGLDDKVSKILEILGMEREGTLKSGVRAVDLHGMGGIGKSTLGSAVHAKLPFKDRSQVRVEVGENPSDDKICNLQKQILERLHQKVNIGDCTEGRQKLKQYLKESCKNPCFFFIDNIFHPKDLDKLLPDQLNEVLPDGSRMLITSRPHSETICGVLSRKGLLDCQKYDVPELDSAHAQSLLCKEIFSSTTCPPQKNDKVSSILELCGGLPLALIVVGRHLQDRKDDDAAWDSAIEDLGNCLPLDGSDSREFELTRALEFGYDKLRPSYQMGFLDVACLLRGYDWDSVKSCTKELEDLERWGLVKRSQEDDEVVVVVHDLLVALAQRKQRERANATQLPVS